MAEIEEELKSLLRMKEESEIADFKLSIWDFPGGPGGLPTWLSGKESTYNAGITDNSLIPGLGRSPEGGHDNPLQYSCLENPIDRRAWQATVHRITKSWTQLEQLSIALE